MVQPQVGENHKADIFVGFDNRLEFRLICRCEIRQRSRQEEIPTYLVLDGCRTDTQEIDMSIYPPEQKYERGFRLI